MIYPLPIVEVGHAVGSGGAVFPLNHHPHDVAGATIGASISSCRLVLYCDARMGCETDGVAGAVGDGEHK